MVPYRILNLLQTKLKKMMYLLMKRASMQWERVRVGPMLSPLIQKSRQNNSLGRNYLPELETREHRILKTSAHRLFYSVVGVELVYLSPYDSPLSH